MDEAVGDWASLANPDARPPPLRKGRLEQLVGGGSEDTDIDRLPSRMGSNWARDGDRAIEFWAAIARAERHDPAIMLGSELLKMEEEPLVHLTGPAVPATQLVQCKVGGYEPAHSSR